MFLGPQSKVLKCGALNNADVQEVMAIVPAGLPPRSGGEVAILKPAILQRQGSDWRPILQISRNIQNTSGYVGIDYIDDYSPFYGYWLRMSDTRSDGKKAFDIDVTWIDYADGTTESSGTEIAWNPAVGRYQEFEINRDPEGFHAEIKNPPHWKPGVKLPSTPGK